MAQIHLQGFKNHIDVQHLSHLSQKLWKWGLQLSIFIIFLIKEEIAFTDTFDRSMNKYNSFRAYILWSSNSTSRDLYFKYAECMENGNQGWEQAKGTC